MPQDPVVGLVLFNISINDLDAVIANFLIRCADDKALGGLENPLENRIRIQNDFDKLENWARDNNMNKDMQSVRSREVNLVHKCRRDNWLGSGISEKDLGVFVDQHEPTMRCRHEKSKC